MKAIALLLLCLPLIALAAWDDPDRVQNRAEHVQYLSDMQAWQSRAEANAKVDALKECAANEDYDYAGAIMKTPDMDVKTFREHWLNDNYGCKVLGFEP